MRKQRIDLTGRQYGDLTVTGKAISKAKGRFWNCLNRDGETVIVKQSDLKNRKGTPLNEGEKRVVATRANNTSGVVGVQVVERKSGTRYIAKITVDKQSIHLGTFLTMKEAVQARKDAEAHYLQAA